MKNRILFIAALIAFLPLFAISNTVDPVLESVTFMVNSDGEIIGVEDVQQAQSSWTTGSMLTHYLDSGHTQKSWNVKLLPGKYEYKISRKARNGKKGKINLKMKLKFKNVTTAASPVVNKKFAPNGTDKGKFTITDFHSKAGGQTPAGYGKLNVKVGRAGANTNVWYSVSVKRISAPQCNYTSLGSDNGNVVGNTRGKFVSSKRACKNRVSVSVTKTGGKAKTTITVYVSDTKNGQGTYKDSYQFPKGNGGGTKTFNITGANGKYVRVEVKNNSAGKSFKWRASATQ